MKNEAVKPQFVTSQRIVDMDPKIRKAVRVMLLWKAITGAKTA
jgi:hypothetical protein